ncbi:hypothetical protein EIN_273440 [Entamoeba invadens IP1]|uniref:Uncharacterized protein n=1 Tax=Entamoeba invadens IP1 TaxID=370355 RepID=A0A0A1U1D1_ENTIV|nr:hypothetical protein EIN_273440 [Entamoeba invadens IP1]ELP87817.1 hypothetical protein EIN_273440 [Entamoeba invadens IP1]|eukprot:XP_004254588.1 hypothetical protein EIN_273440 [Entamoeba invadens IP1]
MKNFLKVTKIDVAAKAVGGFGKKVIGGVSDVGKKAVTNPFGTIGDALIGSAEQRSDVDYLFKDKKVVTKAYGSLIRKDIKEVSYGDVLVITIERTFPLLNFVSKNVIYKRLDVEETWKIAEILSLKFDEGSNGLIITHKQKSQPKKFLFASSLNRAEFTILLLQQSDTQTTDKPISCDKTKKELTDYIELEKKRQNTDGRLHLVSKEDEIILKKMLKDEGSKIDIDQLQKKLEKQIIVDEASLYKNYLNRQQIGQNVTVLFEEAETALDDLEKLCAQLETDVETIRPGVELIQHNNNKLELVHSNQMQFMECMEKFIDSLLIDPVSLYTVQNCESDLKNATNLDNICKSATEVAYAANYSPPDEMRDMIALKEEQSYDVQVLKNFANELSCILQDKLKVEMDFLKINKVIDFGSALFGKEKTQKETLENAHKSLEPFGGLIAWLRKYSNDDFVAVRNQYVDKMSKIANEHFSILVDEQKKQILPMSSKHEDMFDYTTFDGKKIEGVQGIPTDLFYDNDPKKPNNLPMFLIVQEVIKNISKEVTAEFKFLFEVFQMEVDGRKGINVMIDDVYKEAYDVMDKLINEIEENDPMLLLKTVYYCLNAECSVQLNQSDYTNILSKVERPVEESGEDTEEESMRYTTGEDGNEKETVQRYEVKDDKEVLKRNDSLFDLRGTYDNEINYDESSEGEQQKVQGSRLQKDSTSLLQANSLMKISRQKNIELVTRSDRKMDIEWLIHFFDVLKRNALTKFNTFIDQQIEIIVNTIINPKKHGVTLHFKRFPFFFAYLKEAAGSELVWKDMNVLVEPTITKLLRKSFDWLKSIKDSQIDQKPTMTLRFQNFYYFAEFLADDVITSLTPFIKEAKQEYMIALKNLCEYHVNIHFGKFFEFFDHVARLIPSMKRPEEIAYQSNYSKQNAAKICKLIGEPSLIKAIDYICRSIKHHIIMPEHREKAWGELCKFLKCRYEEAENNCNIVYKHKFDVPSENLEILFNNSKEKTYKKNADGVTIEDSEYSETFVG